MDPIGIFSEGKWSFVVHPPVLAYRIATPSKVAALAGLDVTRECERFAFLGHMGGHASTTEAVDTRYKYASTRAHLYKYLSMYI